MWEVGMKIIIDTLGSDLGYEELVKGSLMAMETKDIDLCFVGPEDEIKKIIENKKIDEKRIEYIDTKVYIQNDEDPARSLRRKKDSSTVLGLNRLNEDGYHGFVSAGSTGALLAGGLFITKRIDKIDRAVLGATLPNSHGGTVLVDTGANMDTKPDFLRQFAIMGSIYASRTMDKEKPKVYLLNVGEEEGKGDLRSKETFNLLKENKHINFCGNIEARDMLTGKADVIVTDGFAGNIALKSLEGMASLLSTELKEVVYGSFKTKLGGLLLKSSLKDVAKKYNYKEVGGAPLLGVKKPIFKAHGSSDSKAFMNAIYKCVDFAQSDIITEIEREIGE